MSRTYKPNSVSRLASARHNDSHLSGPRITAGLKRYFANAKHWPQTYADYTQTFAEKFRVGPRRVGFVPRSVPRTDNTTLHPGMDLAVSPLFFCPYHRVGPSSLGLGPFNPFGLKRHCSHHLSIFLKWIDGCYPLPCSATLSKSAAGEFGLSSIPRKAGQRLSGTAHLYKRYYKNFILSNYSLSVFLWYCNSMPRLAKSNA